MARKEIPQAVDLAPHILEDLFKNRSGLLLRFSEGVYWRYDRTKYRIVPMIVLEKLVQDWLLKHHGKSALCRIKSVIRQLLFLAGVFLPPQVTSPCWIPRDIPHLDETFQPEDASHFISLQNLIFDTLAFRNDQNPFLKRSPDFFNRRSLPFKYDPKAKAVVFTDFLLRACDGDIEQGDLALQWLGYLCTSSTSFRKILIILGETASGKSTFTEVIRLLLGVDAVTAVGLNGIGSQFEEASMIGKLANISPECRWVTTTAVEKLKQLSSGDLVTQDIKYQKGKTYKPTARLVLTSNSEPKFADSSEAIWDRLSVLHFPKTIPKQERDRDLIKKLEAELPGIFLMAMESLRSLHQAGHFVESLTSARLVRKFQLQSNIERMFEESVWSQVKFVIYHARLLWNSTRFIARSGDIAVWHHERKYSEKFADFSRWCP